jgi:hypothetical protein
VNKIDSSPSWSLLERKREREKKERKERRKEGRKARLCLGWGGVENVTLNCKFRKGLLEEMLILLRFEN